MLIDLTLILIFMILLLLTKHITASEKLHILRRNINYLSSKSLSSSRLIRRNMNSTTNNNCATVGNEGNVIVMQSSYNS